MEHPWDESDMGRIGSLHKLYLADIFYRQRSVAKSDQTISEEPMLWVSPAFVVPCFLELEELKIISFTRVSDQPIESNGHQRL